MLAARRPSRWAVALVLTLIASLAVAAAGNAATAAPAAQRLRLVIPLVADDAGLRTFAQSVSTPGSPLYGQYEPVPLLAQRFGATSAVRARAVHFLRAAGGTGVSVNPTGMFAEATMTVRDADRVFGVRLERFAGSGGAPDFIAPAAAATASRAAPPLPAGLSGVATGVVGLDTRRLTPSYALPRARPGAYAHGDRRQARAAGGSARRTCR